VNAGAAVADELSSISTLMERAEKSAGLILGQQKTLTRGDALRTINRSPPICWKPQKPFLR
jgi:twitching motility protein PilJ